MMVMVVVGEVVVGISRDAPFNFKVLFIMTPHTWPTAAVYSQKIGFSF